MIVDFALEIIFSIGRYNVNIDLQRWAWDRDEWRGITMLWRGPVFVAFGDGGW